MKALSALLLISIFGAFAALISAEGNDDDGDRIAWMVYQPLSINLTCFRKLNGTGEVGCGSERGGNVGVVHIIQNETMNEDLEWILEKGSHPPYSVGVDYHLVTTDLVEKLASSRRVNGLSMFHVSDESTRDLAVQGYSEDHASPNPTSGCYKPGDKHFGYEWNPKGKSISWRNWHLPIAILQDKKSRYEMIHSCYEKFNKAVMNGTSSGPVCAVEITYRMYAAKDAPTCIRRTEQSYILSPVTNNQCYPLQTLNIHSPLVDREKKTFTYANQSVTVLAVRMDTTSMYEHVGVAADSVVTSLVTYMAVAKALHDLKADFAASSETVYFMLLNGESYDYIGSSRLIRDMHDHTFPNTTSYMDDWEAPPPFELQHIKRWIELDQVGTSKTPVDLFTHVDPVSRDEDPEVKSLIDEMKSKLSGAATAAGLSLKDAPSDKTGLPPSSLQRFLRENKKIAGVVLAGYEDQYVNPYYHSFKETAEDTLNYKCGEPKAEGNQALARRLQAVAQTVTQGVADLIVKEKKIINVDLTNIAEMLECFLCNSNCSLFYNISIREYRPRLQDGVAFPLYTSVGSIAGFVYDVIIFTRRLLVLFTGEATERTHEQCVSDPNNDVYRYDWFSYPNDTTVCMKSTVSYHAAISPAFDIDGYDWKSGEYPTWVESFTSIPTARLFLLPSGSQELVALLSGVLVTAFSSLLAIFCVRKRDMIYPTIT